MLGTQNRGFADLKAMQMSAMQMSAIGLRNENDRRKTFEGFWSDTWPVSPKALAQAGFYYCGKFKDILIKHLPNLA